MSGLLLLELEGYGLAVEQVLNDVVGLLLLAVLQQAVCSENLVATGLVILVYQNLEIGKIRSLGSRFVRVISSRMVLVSRF